jgi:exopolyphosphatase/guanosine-5'-triphosphate,3'-diphosphate pyrophosphatase
MLKSGALIGAVDAGSNAVRFSIYKLDSRLYPLRVHQHRYPVRLGAGTFSTGALGAGDMEAALHAFKDIAATAAKKKVMALPAVATSAIREASNCDEFLQQVQQFTGVELKAITGLEEARLAALGAAPPITGGPSRLVIDVGGGSTELVLVAPDGAVTNVESLPVGAVRLARQWADEGTDSNEMPLAEREMLIRQALEHPLRPFQATGAEPLDAIAIGGAAYALMGACKHLDPALHDNTLTLQAIKGAIDVMAATLRSDYPGLLGVDASRAEILLPGSVVLSIILQTFSITELLVSDAGVREGLVYDYLAQSK